MKDGDLILIGNGLNNNRMEEDIVKSCKENKLWNSFMSGVPRLLGLKEDNLELEVRFKNDRLETLYTIKKDTLVEFQDKKIEFYKGDQIIVGFTYHYERDEFMSYLKMYFGEVSLFTLKDGSYTLVLCKK